MSVQTEQEAEQTFACPCCPEFLTYSKNRLHDHFGEPDCSFWEKVFSGEVEVA